MHAINLQARSQRADLGQLMNLAELDLECNKVSGEYPQSLGISNHPLFTCLSRWRVSYCSGLCRFFFRTTFCFSNVAMWQSGCLSAVVITYMAYCGVDMDTTVTGEIPGWLRKWPGSGTLLGMGFALTS